MTFYFSGGFAARSHALRARISRLRRSCARLDKTAMLRRLVSVERGSTVVKYTRRKGQCPEIQNSMFRTPVDCFLPDFLRAQNMVRVIEDKII